MKKTSLLIRSSRLLGEIRVTNNLIKHREEVYKELNNLREDEEENDEIKDEDIRQLEELRQLKKSKNDPWFFGRRRRRRRRCTGPTKQCMNLIDLDSPCSIHTYQFFKAGDDMVNRKIVRIELKEYSLEIQSCLYYFLSEMKKEII